MTEFTTIPLTGERVLVKGTDQFGTTDETVLSSEEWSEVKRHMLLDEAAENFDAKVEEFFAPLLAAADQLENTSAVPKPDPISYVVIHEGTEAVEGRDEVAIKLNPDSVVLRLLEQGDFERLVWVNGGLEVLEVLDFPAEPVTDDEPEVVYDEHQG